jgi:hypothetical protein
MSKFLKAKGRVPQRNNFHYLLALGMAEIEGATHSITSGNRAAELCCAVDPRLPWACQRKRSWKITLIWKLKISARASNTPRLKPTMRSLALGQRIELVSTGSDLHHRKIGLAAAAINYSSPSK